MKKSINQRLSSLRPRDVHVSTSSEGNWGGVNEETGVGGESGGSTRRGTPRDRLMSSLESRKEGC